MMGVPLRQQAPQWQVEDLVVRLREEGEERSAQESVGGEGGVERVVNGAYWQSR